MQMREKIYAKNQAPQQKETARKPVQRKPSADSGNPLQEEVAYLQNTVGNWAVAYMYESGQLQALLNIIWPGDKYEKEADNVANQVMSMPGPAVEQMSINKKKIAVQTKETPAVTPKTGEQNMFRQNLVKGGGQALPDSTKEFFESRFNQKFDNVRIHTGTKADQSTNLINAKAYTYGNDIVFAKGQYSPHTTNGRRLLAHELTHVMQQREGSAPQVQRVATVFNIIGVIGSIASVVGLITPFLWGSQTIEEIRYPGEAIIPKALLEEEPEDQSKTVDLGYRSHGIITPLDVRMEAYIKYTGYDPITANMGVRFLEEESKLPMGWKVKSKIFEENLSHTFLNDIPGYGKEALFRERQLTYKTIVDEMGPGGYYYYKQNIKLNPFGRVKFIQDFPLRKDYWLYKEPIKIDRRPQKTKIK